MFSKLIGTKKAKQIIFLKVIILHYNITLKKITCESKYYMTGYISCIIPQLSICWQYIFQTCFFIIATALTKMSIPKFDDSQYPGISKWSSLSQLSFTNTNGELNIGLGFSIS